MNTIRAAIAAGLLVSASLFARADDALVKKELQTRYDAFAKAFTARDIYGVTKLTAPGFTTKTADGRTMTAKAALELLSETMKGMPAGTKMVCTVAEASSKTGKAVSKAHTTMTVHLTGADGKPHTMVMQGTSTDTWTKLGGSWKMLEVKETSQSVTMDGQPIDLNKTGGGAQARSSKPR